MRNDERGLTTLEWLLIVAAVAGIAALAVVLVQNVVSDVSEQIAGSNARVVAAQLAGEQIERDAQRPDEDQPPTIKDADDWQRFYESRCERLRITYGDAGVEVFAYFVWGSAVGKWPKDTELADAKTSRTGSAEKAIIEKKSGGGAGDIYAGCSVTTG